MNTESATNGSQMLIGLMPVELYGLCANRKERSEFLHALNSSLFKVVMFWSSYLLAYMTRFLIELMSLKGSPLSFSTLPDKEKRSVSIGQFSKALCPIAPILL